MGKLKNNWFLILFWAVVLACLPFGAAYATPTTLIWAPSTDIQPYKKIHLNTDVYIPTQKKDVNGQHLYIQQVYGPTVSLLSDKPADKMSTTIQI